MRRLTLVLAALALPLGAVAQDKKEAGGDKIGKDKAPTVAKKMIVEVQKRKCAAIAQTGEMTAGGGNNQKVSGTFEGVLRKDFAGVKGTLEMYAQGAKTLVNTGARFDPPEDLEGPQVGQAATFKNPALLLNEVSRLVNTASFLSDETVDGKECKELTFVADEATVKQYLKEIADRMGKQMRGFGGGFGAMIDWSKALDEKTTVASYSVLVGKADLLVYKIVFVIKPKINPKGLPQQFPPQFAQMELDQRYEVKFSKWDGEVAFEVPAAIKAKWGIK
ncbi:MAG TPA: hypothetical protein VJB14_15015 [Planctomycetota bacterium]|nr:hypothetical protein [Planctomycetota bacterium]